jgi:hypothetical protein
MKVKAGAMITNRSALNPAWVALVEILARIEQQPYHWPVGRTLFQKITYVATNEGLPTGCTINEAALVRSQGI